MEKTLVLLKIGEGDRLFAYVYLDPANPPKELMLQFNDGPWEHRAYWGEDLIDWGQAGTASRLAMGPLPEAGKWVRLEVEAAKVALGPGSTLNGWAFTQFDGTVYWDHAGVSTLNPQDGRQFRSMLAWEEFLIALIFTSSPAAKTIPVAIAEFTGRHAIDFIRR